MPQDHRTERLLAKARELGFEPAGVCRAEPATTFPAFDDWLDNRMHGDTDTGDANRGMTYLVRHRDARRHPAAVLPGAKSLIVVALGYAAVNPPTSRPPKTVPDGFGLVAEYARGLDYHDVVRSKLRQLAETHHALFPGNKTRIAVDTAPILEREYAARAGLGWSGKNTMLISDRHGSRFFLGMLLSTAELCGAADDSTISPATDFDAPERRSFCGTCRRCVDACPTGALATPYRLDARRCINFWSIEYAGNDIPPEIAARFGNRLFGCETCQSVCPFNRPRATHDENPPQLRSCCPTCQPHEKFRPSPDAVDLPESPSLSSDDFASLNLREQLATGLMSLVQIEQLDDNEFRRQCDGTPLMRLGLARLKRNAVIVRNNLADK